MWILWIEKAGVPVWAFGQPVFLEKMSHVPPSVTASGQLVVMLSATCDVPHADVLNLLRAAQDLGLQGSA